MIKEKEIYMNNGPTNALLNKKLTCSGIGKIMIIYLHAYDIHQKIKNIIGHSKSLGYDAENQITDEDLDHEWNAVKIGEKSCLIDIIWGAGSADGHSFFIS